MKKRKARDLQRQAKKNPGGAPITITQTQLDVQPWNRGDKDTKTWRTAMQAAESRIPRRSSLYDLYADVELDGHVEAVTGKRKDAVTSAQWQFVDKDGTPVEEINEIIDSIGFENMLEEIVASKFWGYSMFEPKFYQSEDDGWQMSDNLIPRKNMRPELRVIAYDSVGDEGIDIRSGIYTKTIMEVGKVKNLGLYLKCAIPALLKRGGIGDYAMFVQVFGQPIVDAVWNGYDEDQRIKLLEAIKALGSGGGIVRPDGTDVTLLDKNATATGDLQVSFIKVMDNIISKTILGSTETTESSKSSGYAQSETHDKSDTRKFKTDIRFVRRILNSRFKKILRTHGFDLKGGQFIIKEEDEKLTKKELLEMHTNLKNNIGLEIEDDFFYETYGVPKPENYDQLKKAKEQAKPEPKPTKKEEEPEESEPTKKADKPKERKANLSLARQLIKLASDFFGSAPQVGATQTCCGETHMIKLDGSTEGSEFTEGLIASVKAANGQGQLYPELFAFNIDPITKAFVQGWNKAFNENPTLTPVRLAQFGIEYDEDDHAMKAAWEMNLFKFSTIKAAYQSAEVNALFRTAKNFNEFERMVRKLYGTTNLNYLRTEYNTAHQVGQSASTYYRLVAQKNIFPYWEYRTIADDKVRESHRLLHGRILPADHALWAKIFPPNDWNCRCYVVPRLSSEVDQTKVSEDIAFVENFVATSPAWEKAEENGFGINRAIDMEVFTEDQQYTSNPDQTIHQIGGLGFSIWGLLSLAESQAAASDTLPDLEAQELGEDYAGRPISGEGFSEVVSQPDEVWAMGDLLTYIKHFVTGSVQVVTQLNESGDLVAVSSGSASEERRGGALVLSI